MSTFGERVKEYRDRLGMKQLALASQVGLGPSYLSKIENRRRPPPSLQYVKALARVLRLEASEVVEFLQLAGYSAAVLQDPDWGEQPAAVVHGSGSSHELVRGLFRRESPAATLADSGHAGSSMTTGVGDIRAETAGETLDKAIEELMAAYQLPPALDRLARRLITDTARTICDALAADGPVR